MTTHGMSQLKVCPECGADSPARAARCWMCGGDIQQVEPIVQAELATAKPVGRRPANPVSETFFAISTCLVVGLVLLVGLGLAVDEPGMAMFYAIIVSPALLATLVRSIQKQATHGHVTWGERFATLIISGALTLSLLPVLCLSACPALLISCLTMYGR